MKTEPQPAGEQEGQSTKWRCLTVGFASSDHVLMIIFGKSFLYHKTNPQSPAQLSLLFLPFQLVMMEFEVLYAPGREMKTALSTL